jgi:hypothetical protein
MAGNRGAPPRRRGLPLALGLAALALLPPLLVAGPAAAVDYTVDSVASISDTTREQAGSIIVLAGGQLTIRNATVSFQMAQEGGSSLRVDAGGTLILEDCHLQSGTPGLHWNFLVSGRLEMRGCQVSDLRGDSGLGGIEVTGGNALIEDSAIRSSKYYGLFLRSGSPTIRRTTLEGQVVGISVLPGASPTLEDVVIRNSTSIGLKVADAEPVVRNLTVLGSSNFAVGAIGATLDIRGCVISGGAVGIDAVDNTHGTVDGCQVSDVGTGVRAQAAPLVITNSTFASVGTGVNASQSAVEVRGSTFSGFGVGVRAIGPVAGVFGGSATDNDFCGPGIAFESHSQTFFVGDNRFCPGVTSLRLFHTVTLEVRGPDDSPAAAALIEITDADGAAVFAGATDVDGTVSASLEEYRVLPTGERHNATPHRVRIDYRAQVTVTTVNATSDDTIRITLAPKDPDPPLAITREGLLLVGAVFAVLAAVSASVVWRASKRREEREAGARRPRRRGPRSGR